MSLPMVSVIMAAYNAAEYVREAVNSILAQAFTDFEFVIVNDGSKDGTGDILNDLAGLDSRIEVLHQENRGLPVSLNRAIDHASGVYLARMDADDISLPERLQRQVEFMEAHQEIGLLGTACRMIGDASGVSWTMTDPNQIKARLLLWPCIVHPTVMMRRHLVVENDLRYNTDFKQAEDYELWTRFSEVTMLANLPEVDLLYRVTSGQKTARYEDDVTGWSALIQRRQIEKMGIAPSHDEMRIHVSLHKSEFDQSRDYIGQVERWICKLIESNNESGRYDPDALALALGERWKAVCAAQAGLYAWQRYISSPICKAGGIPVGEMSFRSYSRRALSKLLDRSSVGRALKDSVRGFSGRLRRAGRRAA